MEHAEQIERNRMLPHEHLDVCYARVLHDRSASAIVQHVQLPEARNRLLDRAFDAFLFRHIRLDEKGVAAVFAYGSFTGAPQFSVDFGNRDLRSLLREKPRGGPRDAGTRAAYECHLSI